MASTKSTETPKKEGKFLKPDQIILDGDSKESENDTVDDDDDDYHEQLGPDQSLLQWELIPSQSDYTYCVQVQIPLLKHHTAPVSESVGGENKSDQQTLQ